MPVRRILIAFLFVLLLHGCGLIGQRIQSHPDIRPEAEARLRLIGQINRNLTSSKGIGNVRLVLPEGPRNARMAWAVEEPSRLRIQLLGFTGQPIQSISYNGKRLFLVSHLDRRYYSKRRRNPSLARLIGIDIQSHDIVELFLGRAPMVPFRQAVLERHIDDGSDVLILSGKCGVQKIRFARDREEIKTIERFGPDGRLVYCAAMDHFKNFNGFILPARLILSNANHVQLALDVERCWPNAEMDPELFVLPRPI